MPQTAVHSADSRIYTPDLRLIIDATRPLVGCAICAGCRRHRRRPKGTLKQQGATTDAAHSRASRHPRGEHTPEIKTIRLQNMANTAPDKLDACSPVCGRYTQRTVLSQRSPTTRQIMSNYRKWLLLNVRGASYLIRLCLRLFWRPPAASASRTEFAHNLIKLNQREYSIWRGTKTPHSELRTQRTESDAFGSDRNRASGTCT